MDKDRFSTPMMRQYAKIKSQYKDCLLLFRMGDFYELFLKDAKIAAEILDITLTSRNKGKDGKIPMAGVPYHAIDSYLPKLVKAGYKVAICEQISEPDGSDIVERDVVRIVTSGTVLDEKSLDGKENNHIITAVIKEKTLGIAAADLSTGDFQADEYSSKDLYSTLLNELTRYNPAEIILPEELYNDSKLLSLLRQNFSLNINRFHEWDSYTINGIKHLQEHYQVKTLQGFNLQDKMLAVQAAAALLGYLKYTQKDRISHLKQPRTISPDKYVRLDRSTIFNLEIFRTIRGEDRQGSLLNQLDKTKTAMGGRMLRNWIINPLTEKAKIQKRLDSVEEFVKKQSLRKKTRQTLSEIADIERLISRLSSSSGNARDLISLKESLKLALQVKQKVSVCKTKLIQKLTNKIDPQIDKVIQFIEENIKDEPPADMKSGGIIKSGVDKELDELRETIGSGKGWIANIQQKERKGTGISSLKVGFNKVYGYYIEVSRANLNKVPDNYVRKQTLVNAERFITPELKKHEETVLTAEDRINELEYELFLEAVSKVLDYTTLMQKTANSLARLDCLINFAQIAVDKNYTRPEISEYGRLKIKKGRHPVVEETLGERPFVPNDVELSKNKQLLLITGPNMAGKSVFIRQVALITLLAHIGSFVPAKKAKISIVDQIFVRSGASDAVASGLSTFMVEMVETANILNHATNKSLIVMDEIGRGTSTYDGISLAWAIAEFLVSHREKRPKTLFATHYHELQALAEEYKQIKNLQMAVKEENGEPIFLYKAKEGGASHSYGIAVAKMAGVPGEIVRRAKNIINELEKRQVHTEKSAQSISAQQVTFLNEQTHPVLDKLKQIEINKLTPIEALEELNSLKGQLYN